MELFERVLRARNWNDDEQQILHQVQRMVDEVIAPNAAHIDRTGEFPWKNVEAINALGLNAIFVPEEFGGTPMSFRLYLEIVSIISEACASTGIIYATNYHGMKPLIDYGNDEQRDRLLPRIAAGGLGALAITEPTAGSDATGMKTSFTPDGDDIVVTGSKIFISNGDVADLYLLFGKWSEIDSPRAAISVLILEKGAVGFSVISKEKRFVGGNCGCQGRRSCCYRLAGSAGGFVDNASALPTTPQPPHRQKRAYYWPDRPCVGASPGRPDGGHKWGHPLDGCGT